MCPAVADVGDLGGVGDLWVWEEGVEVEMERRGERGMERVGKGVEGGVCVCESRGASTGRSQ